MFYQLKSHTLVSSHFVLTAIYNPPRIDKPELILKFRFRVLIITNTTDYMPRFQYRYIKNRFVMFKYTKPLNS